MNEIEGIIVNEIDYQDKSKIIYVLTNNGLISMIAKGCKSPKSILRPYTDKLTYGKFYIKYKENKLSILNNFDNYINFKNIRNDFNKLGFSMYLLNLSYQVAKENFKSNVYYNLIEGLKKMEEGINPLVITNIIELKYLNNLGVEPILDKCSCCMQQNNIVGLSISKGGLVCSNCFSNDMLVDEKVIKLIRLYYCIDIKKIKCFNVDKSIVNEINRFLDNYYEKYTGLYLNGKKVISDIFNRLY